MAKVILYAGDGAIVQVMQGSDMAIAATAAALDLQALPIPPDLDTLGIDVTHHVVDGEIVALP